MRKTKQFESDIRTLKSLAVKRKKNNKKYEPEYLQLRDEIAKRYDVTIRAVQKWVKAKTPWVRDKRDDAGKERVKLKSTTKRMLNDAIESGHLKKDAVKIVSSKTGEKISQRKLDKALNNSTVNDHTSFGNEAKEFFRKLFEIDLIPPDKGIKMKYHKTNFIINKSDLEDIMRILANAYNRYAESKDKLKVNRASFRKSKLWQLYDEAVSLINDRGVNIADLKEISLFIQRLEIDRNKINPRVITFWKILQNFKHDITLDEVISMAEEYEGLYD